MPCRAGGAGASGLGGAGGGNQNQAELQTSQAPTPSRDHDDDVSLVEACRKLNEVIGLKGVSRWGSRTLPHTGASGWGLLRGHRPEAILLPPGISNRLSSLPAQMGQRGPRRTTLMTSWGASTYPSG